MRVQTEEWRSFVPGVRMYKGKKTLFYNGDILRDDYFGQFLIYDREERDSWEVIIVLLGVEVIPSDTFYWCRNVKTVIMADSVKRVEDGVFFQCQSLEFVKLSKTLKFIGEQAFFCCKSLPSIFIPPSCRQIWREAFHGCKKLIILSVPQDTHLGLEVIQETALIKASHFKVDYWIGYSNNFEVNDWIKNMNRDPDEKYVLHRECSAFNPDSGNIYEIVKSVGIQAFHEPNSIGITPAQYLEANYFAEIDQAKIINRYILDLMGETV